MKQLTVLVKWFLADPAVWAPVLAALLEGFATQLRANPQALVALLKELTADPQ